MSKREEYEEKTVKLLEPILEKNDFYLWDVEYVKEGADYYLRAYIDKEGGITIDDCVTVSRALSDELDKDDFIEDAYILEVSSPGLGRTLKKDKDYERSIGCDVDIKLYKPLDGTKELTGELISFDKDNLTIKLGEEEKIIAKSLCAKVSLSVDF